MRHRAKILEFSYFYPLFVCCIIEFRKQETINDDSDRVLNKIREKKKQ